MKFRLNFAAQRRRIAAGACLALLVPSGGAQSNAVPDAFITFSGADVGAAAYADGPAGVAEFWNPQGIAADGRGNFYVADTGNSVIRKILPDGSVTTLAGSAQNYGSADGASNNAMFNFPSAITVDGAGNLYLADTASHTIRKMTPDGSVSTLAGFPGNAGHVDGAGNEARFQYPSGIAVDSAGNLFVADTYNDTIRKVTPAGSVSTFAGAPETTGFTDGIGGLARFNVPWGLAIDRADNLYVADSQNNTIRVITPAGVVSTLAGLPNGNAGSVDGAVTNARFYTPTGIAVDGAGTVYVSELGNQLIRRIDTKGVVSTLGGTLLTHGYQEGLGGSARFSAPYDLAADNLGNLYIADSGNNVIRFGFPGLNNGFPGPLQIQTSGGLATVSWTTNSAGFILQSSPTLNPPNWTAVTEAVTNSGGFFSITAPITGPSQFFRLETSP